MLTTSEMGTGPRVLLGRFRTPEETQNFAREYAGTLQPTVALSIDGDLGAGKTEFVKGLAAGFDCEQGATSPTFAIAQEYVGNVVLYHFDFYRLEKLEEVRETGFEDCLGDGVVVVEWGSKFPSVFPADTLRLLIEIEGEDRLLWLLGDQC